MILAFGGRYPAMREMLPLREAQKLVLSRVGLMEAEKLPLGEALGRVSAAPVFARDALPPFDCSAMDGYALRSEDSAERAEVTLTVQAELPAGQAPREALKPGCCMVVMTGAPIPEGADVVVPREKVRREGPRAVIPGNLEAGTNVIKAGSDIQRGSQILDRGDVIGVGEVAMLAAQGLGEVKVYQLPTVAVLTTGDELLDVEEPLAPGKIRNSNGYMIAAAIEEAGGRPLPFPPLPDDLEKTKEALVRAAEVADLVLSTGGVSVGDYDLVRRALFEIADEVLFWRVRIKPGMPVVAAVRGKTLYLGLSGKPGGALVDFYLLAAPVIAKMGGRKNHLLPPVKAVLESDFPKSSPERTRYLWGRAYYNGSWRVLLSGGGELAAMQGYNALVEIPWGSGPLAAGDIVDILLLKGVVQT